VDGRHGAPPAKDMKPDGGLLWAAAGLVLLAFAVVGGGMRIFDIEIPSLKRWQRWLLGLIGLLCLSVAIAPYVVSGLRGGDGSMAAPPSASTSSSSVTSSSSPVVTSALPPVPAEADSVPLSDPPSISSYRVTPTVIRPGKNPSPSVAPPPPVVPPRPVITSTNPIVPAVIQPEITSPANGHTTIETAQAVEITAAPPASGHHWYIAVDPDDQAGFYLYEAAPMGADRYSASVGIGPSGTRGVGKYTLHLADIDAAGVDAIAYERAHNHDHYNNFGMALPPGTRLVDSVTVERIG
jgi:hypothetical protein